MNRKNRVLDVALRTALGVAILGGLAAVRVAEAGPYVPIATSVAPEPGDGIPGPTVVPGKEYSHELDRSSTGTPAPGQPNVQLDDQQNTMWDGSGGVADTFDYNGADGHSGNPNDQVDAIANYQDALFHPVIANQAALLFSTRLQHDPVPPNTANGAAWDAALPVSGCGTGQAVGGTGPDDPICVESNQGGIGTWATWPQVDQHLGYNLDGLEVWGAEAKDDANVFSLYNDAATGNSLYYTVTDSNNNVTGTSVYATLAQIAGFFPGVSANLIDIDALMVWDGGGLNNVFDNPNDYLLFSLWPIAGAPDEGTPLGFDVGDAVYVANFGGGAAFLNHGGHLWDNNWTGRRGENYGAGLNVDALEAVATPELDAAAGTGALSLLAGALALVGERRRRRA